MFYRVCSFFLRILLHLLCLFALVSRLNCLCMWTLLIILTFSLQKDYGFNRDFYFLNIFVFIESSAWILIHNVNFLKKFSWKTAECYRKYVQTLIQLITPIKIEDIQSVEVEMDLFHAWYRTFHNIKTEKHEVKKLKILSHVWNKWHNQQKQH